MGTNPYCITLPPLLYTNREDRDNFYLRNIGKIAKTHTMPQPVKTT
jgi:hypothetical protein